MNGRIDDAEIDLILEGTDRAIDRYLVTGIRELKRGQQATAAEVKAMREVCETRGLMCPGMHGHLADPVTPGPSEDAKRTFFMWTVGTKVSGLIFSITGAVVGSCLTVIASELLFRKP